MRIAMVVPGGVDRSGEYRVIPALLALIERIAQQHELIVFALRQEARAAQWTLLGATVINIGAPLTVPRAIAALRREHARAPFDLVHAIWGGSCALVSVSAAKMLGIPSLVHLAGGELAALPDIQYGGRLRWHRRLLDSWTLRRAGEVTAASQGLLRDAARLGISAVRVPLGVDLTAWPPMAPRRREPTEPPRLIHVASLNRVKDQPTLLGAIQMLAAAGREFHLDIVGEDTLSGVVQAQAVKLGIAARITFHGFLTQRQLRPLVEAAHINLVSSLHEAGPLVALEAAVAGVPTVGTSVGHIAEWAPDAALSGPLRDPAALAAAVARLLDDEDLRLNIAHASARIAITEDADHTARKFLALYHDLTRT